MRMPLVPWLWDQLLYGIKEDAAKGDVGDLTTGADNTALREPLRWLELMSEVEPEYHRSLTNLLVHPMDSEENRWAVGLLTFTLENSGEHHAGGAGVHELIPNGGDVAVTDANKARYVAERVRHKATRVSGASTMAAMRAMRSGLDDVVPVSVLIRSGFTPLDVCRAVCGLPDLDPRAWRRATRHCDFGGESQSCGGGHVVAEWFWRAVESLSPDERASLLSFWTGASTLGPTGFDGCEFRLTLARHLTPESLPESQTCSRTIKLAEYRGYEELRGKLVGALEFGACGFAFA